MDPEASEATKLGGGSPQKIRHYVDKEGKWEDAGMSNSEMISIFMNDLKKYFNIRKSQEDYRFIVKALADLSSFR